MTSPTENDARFACEQLATGCDRMEHLVQGLLNPEGGVAEKVHAIRKLGKTLRGGFSLFRLEKTSAREIQAIGRLLSEPRDAVSRLNSWRKLRWKGDGSAAAIAGLLNQQTHSAASQPPPEAVSWCAERAAAARSHLKELPAEHLAERIEVGIQKLRKQVAKRCREMDHRAEEDFHDARKALKAYLGAVGFLPEGSVVIDPRMTTLAELLGDENDLATLSNWLEGHGFTADFVPSLWKKLKDSRSKLRRRAIREAAFLELQDDG